MMSDNESPRLRYPWHYVKFVNDHATGTSLAGSAPFVARYHSFKDLVYELPEHPADSPWKLDVPVKKLSGSPLKARADLILYRCSDDEGTVAQMFSNATLHTPQRFNGILLVRTRYWFAFARNGAATFANDQARYVAMHNFFLHTFFDATPKPFIFALSGAGLRLPRIAVVLQPHFTFAPLAHNDHDPDYPPDPTPSRANVVVKLVKAPVGPPAPHPVTTSLNSATGAARILEGDLGPCLARFALGISPTNAAAPHAPVTFNNTPITVADIGASGIPATVAKMLGDPRGSAARVVSALP